ncbi:2,3-bisphosphoglycerate-independent phosphoglycerate mutase [Vampirovibrio sp.]|uniref:2,3-bisphosphoglycerate-independent phosphoglycerate mutase n=1 Tax=Vampirovibrio sp. TaxID=2717857 RepID=UPI003594777A
MKKTVALLILDGWGIREEVPGNAIKLAEPSYYDSLLAKYPHIALEASGEAVGLPEGQMGNSEVGHLNMGAGRVVYQEITRINKSIRDGDFFTNPTFLSAVNHVKHSGGTLHLMGLVSDGGVHSSLNQVLALLDFCKQQSVSNVKLHAFLDGRDVSPQSAEKYLQVVEEKLLVLDLPQIATIHGRYYAMDRDNRWERTLKTYENLVLGNGRKHPFSVDSLLWSYRQDVFDEFVEPAVCDFTYEGMQDGDAILFFNFRPDRARQLTRAFMQPDFTGFDRQKVLQNLYFGCLTLYDETFNLPVAYPKQRLDNILAQVLSAHGLTQFRTAETEKYAHVTFFFNGGFEQPYPGEERHMVPSPQVATYDLQPEMNVALVSEVVCNALDSGQYDFLVVNFANPDMVGHTGVLQAAEEAVKAIDLAIQHVVQAALRNDGVLLITADHGNCEVMVDENGGPHTAHTTNLVPFILVSNRPELDLDRSRQYSLSDMSPTILSLFGIPKPPEMTSPSLLKINAAAASCSISG